MRPEVAFKKLFPASEREDRPREAPEHSAASFTWPQSHSPRQRNLILQDNRNDVANVIKSNESLRFGDFEAFTS